LGINLSDYHYVGFPTTFSLDNRRVYQPTPSEHRDHRTLEPYDNGVLDMDFRRRPLCIERVARLVLKIVNHPRHRNVRGMIHTNSNDVRDELAAEMIKQDTRIRSRLICHGRQTTWQSEEVERDEVKGLLLRSTNGILMSPSMSEGLDLPDADCRFSIIAKAPVLRVKVDKYLAARAAYFDRLTCTKGLWQKWQELGTLIQTCGRGVRHDHDWCDTYFVDTRINKLLDSCLDKKLVPQSFSDAVFQFNEKDIPCHAEAAA